MSKARQKQRAKLHTVTAFNGKSERRHHAEALVFVNQHQGMLEEIQASVPACLIWAVAQSIMDHPKATDSERAFTARVIADLKIAAAEPFAGTTSKLATDGMRAAWRLGIYAYDVPEGGRAYGSLFMASIFWLQALLEADFWELQPGGAFDRAATALIEDLETHRTDPARAETFAKMEKSARKLASRMQDRLESLGLFVGALEQKAAA